MGCIACSAGVVESNLAGDPCRKRSLHSFSLPERVNIGAPSWTKAKGRSSCSCYFISSVGVGPAVSVRGREPWERRLNRRYEFVYFPCTQFSSCNHGVQVGTIANRTANRLRASELRRDRGPMEFYVRGSTNPLRKCFHEASLNSVLQVCHSWSDLYQREFHRQAFSEFGLGLPEIARSCTTDRLSTSSAVLTNSSLYPRVSATLAKDSV